jgi:hypothetical protein
MVQEFLIGVSIVLCAHDLLSQIIEHPQGFVLIAFDSFDLNVRHSLQELVGYSVPLRRVERNIERLEVAHLVLPVVRVLPQRKKKKRVKKNENKFRLFTSIPSKETEPPPPKFFCCSI